jgi:protein-tyrosine phosphatase
MDGVFIGNERAAYDCELLRDNGITHIMSAGEGLIQNFPSEFVYKSLAVEDNPMFDILPLFAESNEFIDDARRLNGRVLVHCH